MTPVLAAERLSIRDRAGRTLVTPLDLVLEPGGTATLIGESGAGKSLVCAAVAGTLPPGLRAAGKVWIAGRNASALPVAERRRLWARDLFLLPQEPWHVLAPARTSLAQTADTARLTDPGRPHAIARTLLARLGLHPGTDGRKRPWQLSGGMAQRVAVAAALAAPAPLVLVDEPTKGLDAPLRDRVRDSLLALSAEGRALLLVTHDLALAKQMEGELLVLREGTLAERGDTRRVLAQPRHPFTRALVEALPDGPGTRPSGHDLLRVEALTVRAGSGSPPLVHDLSFAIGAGEVVGLQGPSGSGKTTLGNTILGLHPPTSGRIAWRSGTGRAGARQKLYQDPGAAFAPWRPLRASLADALAGAARPRATLAAVLGPTLARMRLDPSLLDRRPAEVSGGELQRLAIARAAIARPAFLFADEPTSRLDPLTQRDVLMLLARLAEAGTSFLLASHDPAVLRAVTTRVIHLG